MVDNLNSAKDYTEKFSSEVSNIRKSEGVIIFTLIDDATRFCIAHKLAVAKGQHQASLLSHFATELAVMKPIKIITYGADSLQLDGL